MYLVQHLLQMHGPALDLRLAGGLEGIKRKIQVPEVQRPGICLAGRLDDYAGERILVLGASELSYLSRLNLQDRENRLRSLLTKKTPAVVVARNLAPIAPLESLCDELSVPLLCSSMPAMDLVDQMMFLLREELSQTQTLHATLIEIFGLGMLLRGHSSIGKSEAALGLIQKGHRLICDDVANVRLRVGQYLEGSGPELTQHLLEIRGIGIVDIAHLYGSVCVRNMKQIDLVVRLEEWDEKHFYDRVGLDERFCAMHGRIIPYYILPVKPNRDVVLLIETLARLHHLRFRGYQANEHVGKRLMDAAPTGFKPIH